MKDNHRPSPQVASPISPPFAQVSTHDLIGQTLGRASLLVKKEVELAKTEIKADLKSQMAMVEGLGVAAVCAIIAICMLLVALVFGIVESRVMSGWLAALLVAGVVLAIGIIVGVVGWSKRVTTSLAETRRTLEENVQWAKNRIA